MNKILELRGKIERAEDRLRRIYLFYNFCQERLEHYNSEMVRNRRILTEWYETQRIDYSNRVNETRIFIERLENLIKGYNQELVSIILLESSDSFRHF